MSAVNLIPKIEGFQPIPNAVMIPFMEAQSAALAYGFGLNYEYGKRKIRSMSNEQYNSLTSEDITNMSNEHTHIILSQFQLQVPRVMPMQIEIFKQYVEIEKQKVLQNVALAKWVAANAPSILLGGTTSDDAANIREDTKAPPTSGTHIRQDAQGNVTVTTSGQTADEQRIQALWDTQITDLRSKEILNQEINRAIEEWDRLKATKAHATLRNKAQAKRNNLSKQLAQLQLKINANSKNFADAMFAFKKKYGHHFQYTNRNPI